MVQMVSKKKPSWGLAEAKARLSEVLERAKVEPQIIEKRGRAVGVVVDIDQFGEAERRARLGSAESRIRSFLAAAAAVREAGGVELELPVRQPRKSPFARG